MTWDYGDQNRANADLMLGLSAILTPEVRVLPELTGSIWDVRTSNNKSKLWANNPISDPAEEVPFDLNGCSQEKSIFNIGRYSDRSRTSNNESARGSPQLDSGYYLEAATSLASQDAGKYRNECHR